MRRFLLGSLLSLGCATAASPPPGEPPADAAVAAAPDSGAQVPDVAAAVTDGRAVSADGPAAVADGPAVAVDGPAAVVDAPAAGTCGMAGAATGVQRKNLTVDGKPRSYLLSVPATYRAGAPLPLVFAWHGLGGSAMYFRAAHGIEAPAQGAAIFVYPDGLPQPGFGNGNGWDLRPEGDVRFFDALLAEVSGAYCVDKGRVFSMGHSFGGYMTNTLGCLRGAALRGIAPVAGGLPGLMCGTKPLPAWLTHGNNDPVVMFAEGEKARDHWRTVAGCGQTTQPVEPAGCVAYDGCAAPVQWCVHQRMHSWPPFASSAIWKFFEALK
jgi:polyhydroxybutyrate depolymerase